jgi:hypothetical protein
LLYGGQVTLRPIPTASDGPFTLRIYGTVHPAINVLDDDTEVTPNDELDPVLIAGATVLAASRAGNDKVLQVWQPIFVSRLKSAKTGALAWFRQPQVRELDF